MKAKWEDKSSYSQGETNRVPTVWEINVGGVRVIVHRYHGLEGWFGSCYEMNVQRFQLQAVELEEAKAEFIKYLKGRAAKMLTLLERVK